MLPYLILYRLNSIVMLQLLQIPSFPLPPYTSLFLKEGRFMKDLILLFSVAAVFFGCYLAIKKITLLSSELSLQSEKMLKRSSLCIAFENPLTLNAISVPLENFSEKYPECQIRLFSGTSEEILQKLNSASLDFGFVLTASPAAQKYLLFQLPLEQKPLFFPAAERNLEPLNPEKEAAGRCSVLYSKSSRFYAEKFSGQLTDALKKTAD